MEKLHHDLKALIIEVLNLEEITPEDIDTQAPLFGDGLGLDSIDALELGLAIKNQYGIVLSSESEETKKAFYSVKTLADFIISQQ
ncbi:MULTISPECIES: phosphopantetheine-binding protein [unclassified Gilliamella]|uniref:phosphopantetheine-binding protein n=1 Tax=unclassified Gilliamella TaxID=2685620 RepID=UPI000A35ADFC|nr:MULTISPECIES: phosphopantetheine-binding protein [unclassified Gilliamella]OTQ73465.1 acyl carrier protein [Gilliamella sp. N-G2]OTQ79593.1 acyl carrier protein [Gilliamella sp. N-W3]